MTPTQMLQTIAAHAERIEELEYELARLTETAEPETVALMIHFGVTRAAARMLRLMAGGGVYSRLRLMEEVGREDSEERHIDSTIKRLRRKIGKSNVTALYGIGYALPPAFRAVVIAVMRGGAKPAAPVSFGAVEELAL